MPSKPLRSSVLLLALCTLATPQLLRAQAASSQPTTVAATPARTQELYDRVRKSLVAVQYTWESELGRRDVIGAGIVVRDDGLVMAPLALFDLRIPDEQMKDFKLLVPSDQGEPDEVAAQFLGRDERSEVVFLKAQEKGTWQAIQFVPHELQVGERVLSMGLLPKIAGYKAYVMDGSVSARLRGEMPQVLVSGQLAAVGSPVLDLDGQAIGFVNAQPEQPMLLNEPKYGLSAVSHPPVYFVNADALLNSIADPPQGTPLKLPWIGVMQMVGLSKEVSEYFGLDHEPAIQLGDIIPGGPAAQAGLKPGLILTKVNGKSLVRGDEPEELPMILRRQILQMKVGSPVTFTLLDPKTKKTQDLTVRLQERPKPANLAERFWAESLGFGVREMVFMDAYLRKLAPDATGAIVSLVRPQSAAQNARLEPNDMIVDVNGKAVASLEQFKAAYEEFRKEHPHEAVVLVVLREGRNQTIRIEPPQ